LREDVTSASEVWSVGNPLERLISLTFSIIAVLAGGMSATAVAGAQRTSPANKVANAIRA
jgi:hypothetical protein